MDLATDNSGAPRRVAEVRAVLSFLAQALCRAKGEGESMDLSGQEGFGLYVILNACDTALARVEREAAAR